MPTEPQVQDVPSCPPSPPLESTCASKSPLAMGSQSYVNGPVPAGVSAPTYADCLKMSKPQGPGHLAIGGSTTSTKSPNGRRGHGGSAPSHSGAKRRDHPKEKSTKKLKDSEAARGTSSSDTNTNRCVQPEGLPKRTTSKKEKRGPVQPAPAPGTARARSNVKAQIRRLRSSRRSRGRPASRSASSTETVRPVRDA